MAVYYIHFLLHTLLYVRTILETFKNWKKMCQSIVCISVEVKWESFFSYIVDAVSLHFQFSTMRVCYFNHIKGKN